MFVRLLKLLNVKAGIDVILFPFKDLICDTDVTKVPSRCAALSALTFSEFV